MIAGSAHHQPLPFISSMEKSSFLIAYCFPWQDHLVEDHQTCIPEIGPLVVITISPDHQGDGVEVLGGEIAHPDEDHVLPMGENEAGTGIEKETEGEIVKEKKGLNAVEFLFTLPSWDTRSTNSSKATHTVDAHTAEVSVLDFSHLFSVKCDE